MPPVSAQNRKVIAVQFLTVVADDEYSFPQRGCRRRRWLQHLHSPSLKKHAGSLKKHAGTYLKRGAMSSVRLAI